MALKEYHVLREIAEFDLDSYIAHLGWVAMGMTTIKIYSQFGSRHFYLHDEIKDRLFEFSAHDPKKLKSSEEYNKVVKEYLLYQDEI